ncbi:NAD(P)/FAD-dependent oxidoreductase [Kangiella sp. TOML190]|uniref:FAD-dependent oxidoreductase n=1 Tax=Kangiella sp. TOML190 TaxID=2931351 RepID=UPI00203E756E|nr:NAD(P)/FAD-dependent oxidoreductase [Kangiella sp. TOML190]
MIAATLDKNITIVGAGLVGSLMAIYLGQRGYQVTVFEKLPDIRKEKIPAGRSINLALANRGIRPLQQVGIMDKVEKLLVPVKGRMLHDIEGKLQFQSYGQRPEEVIYSVSRAGLVSLLRDEAEATGKVVFHFKHKVDDIDFEQNILSVHDWLNDTYQQHHCDILLGTDGAGSKVRRLMESKELGEFSSELLAHNYKELTIPAEEAGSYLIEKSALHIWPRGGYMLMALPNLEGDFTVTLFMPKGGESSFEQLTDKASVDDFFKQNFCDAYDLIPNLSDLFFENPTGILGTVRSTNWYYKNTLIFGDAAHAIVPFHGQGMNCGFEDCSELNSMLNRFQDDWQQVMPAFEQARIANANAIADMALENYVEMRDSVRDPKFHLKKAIAFELEKKYPNQFIPRYSMVMFHHIPYAMAQSRGEAQANILQQLAANIDSVDKVDWSHAQQLVLELETISAEYLP